MTIALKNTDNSTVLYLENRRWNRMVGVMREADVCPTGFIGARCERLTEPQAHALAGKLHMLLEDRKLRRHYPENWGEFMEQDRAHWRDLIQHLRASRGIEIG